MINIKSKKGQAAMEFLMTYGWAILVVLVAIGALAYFGVLSPDRFLPAKCTLQSGIACLDHKATTSFIQIVIHNSLGYDIDQISVRTQTCGPDSTYTSLANGGQGTYTLTCDSDPVTLGNQPLQGSKYTAVLNISYRIIDTGLQHYNLGQITTRIE